MSDAGSVPPDREAELRDRAVQRLKKRRDFTGHVLVYLLVNAFLVVIWAVTSSDEFFWPVFPILGWGIGLAMHAWETYRREEFSEARVQREIDRLRGSG